jgi:ribose 5-phosphate isomerase B
MKIPIASDHAGYAAKRVVVQILKDLLVDVDDLGTHSEDSVDYPEYAVQVAERIDQGDAELGILICGSGQGVCMTANKYSGVRAALVQDAQTAALTRQHNNSNILCLPGRSLENEPEVLKNILKSWLETPFEGGRHERRVQKISSLTSSHS